MSGFTSQMLLKRDFGSYAFCTDNNARGFSNLCQYFTLTQNVVTNVTVPSPDDTENFIAFFTYTPGSSVFVLPSDTPVLALPTGTVTETTACLNPVARGVKPGQNLQFLTGDTDVTVCIEYYASIS